MAPWYVLAIMVLAVSAFVLINSFKRVEETKGWSQTIKIAAPAAGLFFNKASRPQRIDEAMPSSQ